MVRNWSIKLPGCILLLFSLFNGTVTWKIVIKTGGEGKKPGELVPVSEKSVFCIASGTFLMWCDKLTSF